MVARRGTCLWIILRVPGVKCNLFEVQLAAQVHCGDHILQLRYDARGVLRHIILRGRNPGDSRLGSIHL